MSRAVARGELRKLGPALYTPNLTDPPEQIVARHLWEIVARDVPGSVVSYRTAFTGRPGPDGTVFLSGPVSRRLDLPGLRLRVLKGPGPLPDDRPFVGGLVLASEPRLLLENLGIARERSGPRRTVPREQVELRLESVLRSRGEAGLNALRDRAGDLAPRMGAGREFALLDALIGALLRSRPAAGLQTAAGKGRARGTPFDPERTERFDLLARALGTLTPPQRGDPAPQGEAFQTISFFDAYFSNYIEGTEFEVEEARAIVFDGVMPPRRPADAHDVLGTWRLVGDLAWLRRGVTGDRSGQMFLERVAAAHATLMAGRPEVGPGQWKTVPNQAGGTRFVEPDLVQGTLLRGWEVARALRAPFQRAAMILFVLAEVHPFTDGNGRVARAFMNAELVSEGECRILIPTVYREDYLGALRALSRQDHASPYLLMLDEAQRFTASVRWDDYPVARADLAAANAMVAPEPGLRLRVRRTAV